MTSLEKDVARSGHEVLKKNGRWLASSVDPLREAQQWARQVLKQTGTESPETAIILGLGCGYHVAELAARKPRGSVIVIDCDREIHEKALDFVPSLKSEKIVIEKDWLKLVDSPLVRDAVGGPYRILKHAPSCALEPEFFTHVERLLLGRDKLAFLVLLKARPEILALFDSDLLGEIRDEAVSIKTLQKIFSARSGANRERRLWKVLEELVV